MAKEGEGASSSSSSSSQTIKHGRRVDPLLVTFRFFSILIALTAILCIVVNVISAVRSFRDKSDVFDGIGILGWPGHVANLVRSGFFVAVMTRAFPVFSAEQKELILLRDIASYLLLVCGAVYIAAGILCIGFLKRSRESKETAKERAAKDLKALEKQKQELEQLLIADSV